MKKVLITIIIAVVLSAQLTLNVFAHSMNSLYNTDNTTGWTYNDYHMGKKADTYRFTSTTVEQKYGTYMTNAASIWGNSISFTKSSSGRVPISQLYSNTPGRLASTSTDYYDNETIYSTSLVIHYNNFDALSSNEQKNETLAHEIGHIYGLDHFDGDGGKYLMHSTSLDVSIKPKEIAGMNCMTHSHVHSYPSHYTLTYYSSINNNQHVSRCPTCYSYDYKYNHNFTYSNYSRSQHKKNCAACGLVLYETHTIEYRLYNGTYRSYCIVCNSWV